jgi:hypothetical protein
MLPELLLSSYGDAYFLIHISMGVMLALQIV